MVNIQDHPYTKLGRGSPHTLMEQGREGEGEGERGQGWASCPVRCKDHTRIVSRENGRPNVYHSGLKIKWFGFITDNFTTLVNLSWFWIILIFMTSYLASWLVFGGVWTLVAKLEDNFNGTCLKEVTDFSAALLFSIETQVTIGYGNTFITNDCAAGVFVLIMQCLVGLVLDAILLGLLFTKITRPRNRRKTILFSNKAVIAEDQGEYYLEFRVGNLRKSQIAECHVRLVLYWYHEHEGRDVLEQHDLECGYESGTDRLVLITPAIVRHKIDGGSPLSRLSPSAIIQEDLEVVVVLEGVVEATGLTVQALWSYTSEEMVVGEKLAHIVSRSRDRQWVVDFSRFDEIRLA